MANKNRYWFVKRNQLGLVEDSTGGGSVIGVPKNFQNISGSVTVKIDAVMKHKHFNVTEVPSINNDWLFDGTHPMDQAPSQIPEQFHEALIFKTISMAYEMAADFDPEKAAFFENKYDEVVKKAKTFARRYYNGGTMRINPIDF